MLANGSTAIEASLTPRPEMAFSSGLSAGPSIAGLWPAVAAPACGAGAR